MDNIFTGEVGLLRLQINVWSILMSNCEVMLVTQSAAVAYITRWSTESVKHRGSSVRVSFIGFHVICIKLHFTAWQWYRSHIIWFLISEQEFSFFYFLLVFFLFFSSCKDGGILCHTRNSHGLRSEVAISSTGTRLSACGVLTCLWELSIFLFIFFFQNITINVRNRCLNDVEKGSKSPTWACMVHEVMLFL